MDDNTFRLMYLDIYIPCTVSVITLLIGDPTPLLASQRYLPEADCRINGYCIIDDINYWIIIL